MHNRMKHKDTLITNNNKTITRTILSSIFYFILCFISAVSCSFGTENTFSETEEGKICCLQEIRQTWTDSKDRFSEIQRELTQGTILYGVPLQKYEPSIRMPNQNKVVLLGLEGKFIKAIFKPRGLLHQKVERGAFEIAQCLGMEGLVPPIAVQQLEGNYGIVSYYLDMEEGQNPWKNTFTIDTLKKIIPESLSNFYAFAFVFGMWDLKWVNTIMVGLHQPYHIMSLDNESMMSAVYAPKGEHFFVCWKLDPMCKSSPYEDLNNFKPTILELTNVDDYFSSLSRFFIYDKSVHDLHNEEERKQFIIKRIKSFFWGKKTLPHYIGQKGWWLQLYDGFPNIPPPQVTSLKPFTVSRFQGLTREKLKEFFEDIDSDAPLFSNEYYEAILMRRNNLLSNIPTDE